MYLESDQHDSRFNEIKALFLFYDPCLPSSEKTAIRIR